MRQQALNSGVIFTNKNCIGCNRCISGCPVTGANVVVKDDCDENYTVLVDSNKCILCGTCVNACVHKARTYRDDTDAFLMDLEDGEKISILVSSTLLTDYEKQYNNILGYLKHLGVNHILGTGFGADLMVWVYMNFIKNYGLEGVISQSCPVIVNYLEKYRPELLKYLMPVQSPVMCTAIYASDYLKIEDKLAYISPCIAGKYEIEDVNTYGKVTYHVTFERLIERIKEVDLSKYYAEDEVGYGLGGLVSTSGGLSENIRQFIGFNEVLIQVSGATNIFPYFDHYYYNEVNKNTELPFLVDALSCTDGCNFGTGTSCGYEMRNEMSFSAHRAKEKAFKSGTAFSSFSYKERLEKTNERFKDFELSSFVRQYDNTRRLVKTVLSEDEFNEVYLSMYKKYESQRNTDCGSCGYTTCHNMAYAVGTKLNYKENCINYSKERIRRETEKTNQLLEEISDMNEELKRSTQLKSNFLANMSHEIRTPMNAIIGMAEIALRGELPNEQRGYLQQIKASGRSLLAIINDILDFSKIESGMMELNETEYAVMSLINDTVNIVMTRIGEKDITLMIEADSQIPFKLFGDDIRIKQVLVNLANNAVKFTKDGFVKIILSYTRNEDNLFLTIAVKDSGIGIKPEDQEKLFTSFQQVDSKRNRNIEGTGLGLAISREFVHLMHGEVYLESTYGEGSTFSFRIPQKIISDIPSVRIKEQKTIRIISLISNIYVKESFNTSLITFDIINSECSSFKSASHFAEKGADFLFTEHCYSGALLDEFHANYPAIQIVVIVDPRKDIVSSSYVRKLNQPVYSLNVASVFNNEEYGMYENDTKAAESHFEAPDAKILIVDDNAINLTVAKGLLSPMHMNIESASGALEAIEKIEENKFDIVFMDHMMPDIDGVEATHMIRQKEGAYYKELPIIALTANAINNAKEMFLQEGMNDFVAKPIDMTDIASKLKKWLPQEKIRNIGAGEWDKNETASQNRKIRINGLDVDAGLKLSGSEDLYKAILADYYSAIEKKANLIEKYEAEGNWTAYTIEVHALKSSSKLIGANTLSEMAAELEKCGHDNDIKTMQEKTSGLLKAYRELIPVLMPYGNKEEKKDKAEITLETLIQKLTSLHEAMEDFDIDAAKEVMGELSDCLFNETGTELLDKLEEAVNSMEYDEASEIANEWINQVIVP